MNIAFLMLTALVAQEVEPPSSDQVINRFIEALGGEMVLSDLATRDIRITGRIGGSTGIITGDVEWVYSGEKMLCRMDDDNGESWHVFATDGDVSWQKSSLNPNPVITDKLAGAFSTAPHRYLHYLDFNGEIEMRGPAEFNDEPVWRLRFTSSEGIEVDRFFSRSSGLMVGSKYREQDNPVSHETTFSYQAVDGVMFLSRIVILFGRRQEIEITEIEIDADISDASFSPDDKR